MPKSKYLLAVVVVALMLTLASGASFAADSWAKGTVTTPAGIGGWDRVWGDATTEPISITATNDGTVPWTVYNPGQHTGYGLAAVRGVTGAAALVDRWGTVFQGLTAAVPTGSSVTFSNATYTTAASLTIVSPPLTTLEYQFAGTYVVTHPAVIDTLDNNWLIAKDFTPTPLPTVGTMLTTDTATGQTAVTRWADIGPGSLGAWARTYVEECAGRAPRIVQGYPGGAYMPTLPVTRDAMAVFIARAKNLTLPTLSADPFPDVAMSSFGAAEIQACVDADIVKGYPDGLYRPIARVTRDQMTVYIGRARSLITIDQDLTGGASNSVGPFSDVPSTHWAGVAIQRCVDWDIVQGYMDVNNTFRPSRDVSRDQMAVFIYRAFIQPSGVAVVLGGPGITTVNPGGAAGISLPGQAAYYGWSNVTSGNLSVPTYAYAIFDGARVGSELIVSPATTWDVTFELRDSAGATTPATTKTISMNAAALAGARAAAVATNSPYLTLWWNLSTIPALASGSYTLHVLVETETGAVVDLGDSAVQGMLARAPSFTKP